MSAESMSSQGNSGGQDGRESYVPSTEPSSTASYPSQSESHQSQETFKTELSRAREELELLRFAQQFDNTQNERAIKLAFAELEAALDDFDIEKFTTRKGTLSKDIVDIAARIATSSENVTVTQKTQTDFQKLMPTIPEDIRSEKVLRQFEIMQQISSERNPTGQQMPDIELILINLIVNENLKSDDPDKIFDLIIKLKIANELAIKIIEQRRPGLGKEEIKQRLKETEGKQKPIQVEATPKALRIDVLEKPKAEEKPNLRDSLKQTTGVLLKENQNTKKNLKLGVKKAIEAITIDGITDEKKIMGIFDKYVGDSKADKNVMYFREAILRRLKEKRAEKAYFQELKNKANEQYQILDKPTQSAEDYEKKYIAKHLVGIIVNTNPNYKQGDELKKQQKIQSLEKAIDDGKITVDYESKNINGIKTNDSPVLKIDDDAQMNELTNNVDKNRTVNASMFTVSSEKNNFHVIALRKTGDIDTEQHEITHLLMTEENNAVRDKFRDQIKVDVSRLFIDKFIGNKDKTLPVPESLQNVFNQLLENPNLTINEIKWLNNANDNAQVAKFIEYCKKDGNHQFENIRKVYEKTASNFSSPLEEAVTKFTDMPLLERKLGINDLFKNVEDLNTDKNTKTAAIALMRSMNMIYGDVDIRFYDEHKKEFLELIETYMQEHTGFTINGFMNMIHKLKDKSEGKIEGVSQDKAEKSKDLLTLLTGTEWMINKLQIAEGRNIIKFDDNPAVDQSIRGSIINFLTDNEANKDKLLTILRDKNNLKDFDQTVRQKLIIALEKGEYFDAQIYLSYCLPLTDNEKTGEYTGNEFMKESAMSGEVRTSLSYHPALGGIWGRRPKTDLYKGTLGFLDAVPIPGLGLVSEFLDAALPHSPADKHYKDKGPLAEYSPILPNQKLLREFRWGLDKKCDIFYDKEGHETGREYYRVTDSTDAAAGFLELTGIDWTRSKGGRDFLALFGKDIKEYLPKGLLQPGLNTYHIATLTMIGEALKQVGVASRHNTVIYSVIGGLAYSGGKIDVDSDDFDKPDEYRMNKQFADFVQGDLGNHLKKDKTWRDLWAERFSKDSLTYNIPGGGKGTLNLEFKKHPVMKGTMTTQLMNDICEEIAIGEAQDGIDEFEDMIPRAQKRKDAFQKIATAMMTQDYLALSDEKGLTKRFTLNDLEQLIVAAAMDPRLKADLYSDNDESKANRAYMRNPTIKIGDQEVSVIDAKEFISHYYLARLRTISSVGVWGMTGSKELSKFQEEAKLIQESKEFTDQQKEALIQNLQIQAQIQSGVLASIPNEDDRKYTVQGKRKLSDADDQRGVQMTSYDIADAFEALTDEKINLMCGNKSERMEGEDKKGNKGIYDLNGNFVISANRENSAHDLVTGLLWANQEGKKYAYKFSVKLRQSESFRAMAKIKKDKWEGINNIEDTARIWILGVSLATLLIPTLGAAFSPGLVIGLLGWSLIVSPFINRGFEGWSAREKAAIEATNTLLGQYSEMFYNLGQDTVHTPNEIKAAMTNFENVKNVYKSVLVNMSKHGNPESNFVAKRANSLIGGLFSS
jgi:hypothetical protein